MKTEKLVSNSMKLLHVCFLLQLTRLLALSSSSSIRWNRDAETRTSKPWFCHSIDCPEFRNATGAESFEIREYKDTTWVSTEIKIKSQDEFLQALNQAFMRLFNYISGENEKKMKIDMTAPVLTKVIPGQGPFCKNILQVSFFVPPELAESAPKPTSDDVFFMTFQGTVFVHSFQTMAPGPNGERITQEAEHFGNRLIDASKAFVPEPYYYAGYDPPFRLFGRHDEIWFLKEQASGTYRINLK